jgi:predicted CxxxxCH...CXXCH cytochrome family protein
MTSKFVGVGAHETHLNDSETHRAVACSECHLVPEKVDSKGHIDDGRAEVVFGTLAKTSNHNPTYSTVSGTCENSYCHGSTSGNWQSPRNSVETCGSCHGLPPAAPHSPSTDCANCHGRVVDRDRRIIEPSLHVNGSVEVDFGENCSRCHGTGASGAPPPDLLGNTATSEKGVGAHANHLNPGTSHGALACSECHVVPKRVEESTHLDGDNRAEVVFGSLAKTSGYRPNYDATTVTCTGTYCHRDAKPNWQSPRSSESACGSCHELPPKSSHPKLTDCSLCHGMVIDKAGQFIAPDLHINGNVEVRQLLCNSCHGTDESGAPPPDFLGNMSSSARGVGAHERHSKASQVHGVVACGECHIVPSNWNDPMHLDGALPAEVTFGKLAQLKVSQPTYDVQLTSCTNTYCHGQSVPVWTAPRLERDSCGTCHALPPPLPHPNVSNCSLCHGEVVDATRNFTQPALHVDGVVQVKQVCNVCHGGQQNAAPPTDLKGNVDPSFVTIGAHQVHLSGGTFSREVACTACHIVPTTITSAGHLDLGTTDPADIVFSGVALSPKANPVWNRNSATCSATYCHGPENTTNNSPKWNSTTGNLTCSSCHGMPPASPHTSDAQCVRCHSDVDAQNNIVERALHINGEIDLR